MAKKRITIDVYQCDNLDQNGDRCTSEGERHAIKQCAMCKKDLCSRHYEMLTVARMGGITALTYSFCHDHSEEFIKTLSDTFGDTSPVPYGGMAK